MKTINIGTILVHSIGCGCDSFFQVVNATPRTVVVRELQDAIVKRDIKYQTYDIRPIPNMFVTDSELIRLRIAPDGRIGPRERMIWWSVYDGKAINQYSP